MCIPSMSGRDPMCRTNAVLHGQRGLWSVNVGDAVTIGHGAIVHGCIIEDEVLIGMGAILMNGARIGTQSIVAAGAVVREGMQVPSRSLVAGLPGTVRRSLGAEDLESIRVYAQNYVEYAALYLRQQDALTTTDRGDQRRA